MDKWVNGELVDMTAEEITEQETKRKTFEAAERTRPMTESEVSRLIIAQQINTLTVDDNTALRMVEFYPEWATDTDYAVGFKVQYGGKLYRCLTAHTSQPDWTPDAAPSLWTQICETHAGTADDPIPYSGNMELIEGLYYTQDGVSYPCIRSTGQPVYHALADLVGIYVEMV